MANFGTVSSALQLTPNGNVGDVLTIISAQDIEFRPPPGGGTVGPGTLGGIAVFTGATAVGDNVPGSDVTLRVPNGQQGVFMLNGVSLVTFGGAGFAPTVNGGVASGDAAHVWANVYGRNLLSDLDLGLEAAAGQVVKLRVNGADILKIGAPGVPTTWTWPTADAVGSLNSDGAGNLSFGASAGAWTTVSKPADQATTSTVLILDTDLKTGVLTAGVKYRLRATIFLNSTADGNTGGQAQWAKPASSVYWEQNIQQAFGSSGLSSPNIAAAPILFNNGNAGTACLIYDILITPSANGIMQFQFAETAGGTTTAVTCLAGSYLEYGVA